MSAPEPTPPAGAPPAPRRRSLKRLGLEALVLAVALLGIRAWQTRGAASGPAPEVAGTLVSGQAASLSQLRGRPVLVHFWATWCSICTAERGNVDALARDHAVLAVAVDSGGPAEVREWMRRQGVDFPSVVDPGTLARAYGVQAFPTSFVVGRDGRIRFVETGYTTELGLRLRMALAGL